MLALGISEYLVVQQFLQRFLISLFTIYKSNSCAIYSISAAFQMSFSLQFALSVRIDEGEKNSFSSLKGSRLLGVFKKLVSSTIHST